MLPLEMINHPEDEEVILVIKDNGPLPQEIITAVTRV
jgi:hypothetical protein